MFLRTESDRLPSFFTSFLSLSLSSLSLLLLVFPLFSLNKIRDNRNCKQSIIIALNGPRRWPSRRNGPFYHISYIGRRIENGRECETRLFFLPLTFSFDLKEKQKHPLEIGQISRDQTKIFDRTFFSAGVLSDFNLLFFRFFWFFFRFSRFLPTPKEKIEIRKAHRDVRVKLDTNFQHGEEVGIGGQQVRGDSTRI